MPCQPSSKYTKHQVQNIQNKVFKVASASEQLDFVAKKVSKGITQLIHLSCRGKFPATRDGN